MTERNRIQCAGWKGRGREGAQCAVEQGVWGPHHDKRIRRDVAESHGEWDQMCVGDGGVIAASPAFLSPLSLTLAFECFPQWSPTSPPTPDTHSHTLFLDLGFRLRGSFFEKRPPSQHNPPHHFSFTSHHEKIYHATALFFLIKNYSRLTIRDWRLYNVSILEYKGVYGLHFLKHILDNLYF